MRLDDDLINEIKTARKIRAPWPVLLGCVLASAGTAAVLDHFQKRALTLPILNSIAIIVLAIKVKWALRRYVWFWVIMGFIAALHVLLVAIVPWGTKWVPAIAIAAFDWVDFCAILAILSVVRKRVERRKGQTAGA